MTGDDAKKRKKVILGLDVSTTTVGFSLLGPGDIFPILEYVSLAKFKNLYTKAGEFEKRLGEFLDENLLTDAIDVIYIEEDLQKFTRGMSSAKTIQTLSRFNGMVSLLMFRKFKMVPIHINVTEARNSIGCKIDRKNKKKTTKEKVFDWVEKELPGFDWPTKVISAGPRKGMKVNLPECFDMADAYVVARAGSKKEGM